MLSLEQRLRFAEADLAAHTKRDYYEVLGIKHTATGQEIEGAFLKLATEYHAQGKPANTTRIVRDLIEQD